MEFNPEQCRNETEVESKFLVQYLLPALGYPPDAWFQEVALGQIRLDLMVFASRMMPFSHWHSPPIQLILEAKHPARNLDAHTQQLHGYLSALRVRHGVLTNGKELRLYEWHGGRFQQVFGCRGQDTHQHLDALRALVGRPATDPPEEAPMSVIPSREAAPAASPSVSPTQPKKESTMKTIAIYHNKGGVGKTTTVVNLAAALAKRGLRVLVIDLDAQANTTYAMGLVQFEDEAHDDLRERNVVQVLRYEDSFLIPEVVRRSRFSTPEIDVIPSHIDLMQLEPELNQFADGQLRLLSKLRRAQDQYDVVLIDTPPSLNLYARMALVAADHLIIPSDLKPFANQGLVNVKAFIRNVDDFRRHLNKDPLNVLGVLPTKISTNAKFVQSTLQRRRETVEERYGVQIMTSTIFERDDLAKCTEQVQQLGDREVPAPVSVLDFKRGSASAQEFEALAVEVVATVGLQRAEVVR